MTYAYKHLTTTRLASDSATVSFSGLYPFIQQQGVVSLELRFEGYSTASSGDYDRLTQTFLGSASTWDSSWINWEQSLPGIQSNAVYDQTAGVVGYIPTASSTLQTGTVVCVWPFVFPTAGSAADYSMVTGLSKSGHHQTSPIWTYSNYSYTTTSAFSTNFGNNFRLACQNGNIKAGSTISLYGWC